MRGNGAGRPPRRARLWSTALATATVLLAALLASTANATAAAPKYSVSRVTITSPTAGAVVSGDSVTIRATTVGHAGSVDGWVGTSHFAFTQHGSTWTATLHRGAPLRPGANTVDVSAPSSDGRVAQASVRVFVVGAPAELGLSVGDAGSAGAQAVQVSLVHRVARLGATLNGHDISGLFSPAAGTTTVPLGADDGLTVGANTLTLTAVTTTGTYQRATLALPIHSGAAVAGAGPDVEARTGIPQGLDATPSGPPVPGVVLAYRWHIARAPAGSHAVLVNPTSAHPTLDPDVRGTYHVELEVDGPGVPPARDTVIVNARDSAIPPVGWLLQTQYNPAAPAHSGVQLGNQLVAPMPASGSMVLVLLDRGTLELVGSPVDSDGSSDSVNSMVGAIQNAGSGPSDEGLVAVLSAPSGVACNGTCSYEPVLELLGVNDSSKPDHWDKNIAAGNSFSTVSLLGDPTVQVWRSSFESAQSTPQLPVGPGDLGGYLQLANAGLGPYTFVPDTHVPFDTSASSTPTTNTIQLGSCPGMSCRNMPSAALTTCAPSGTGGFQVAVLGAATLHLLDNATFTTNSGCGWPADTAAMAAMSTLLGRYAGNGGTTDYLVIVQSIGAPRPAFLGSTPAPWQQIGVELGSLGGTPTVFDEIGAGPGRQGYSLLGYNDLALPGSDNAYGLEISGEAPLAKNPAIRETGLLARNHRNDLVPEATAVGGAIDTTIGTTLYQPPTPWPVPCSAASCPPNTTTAGEQAALDYITRVTGPGLTIPVVVNAVNDGSCYDPSLPSFRAAYCDTSLDKSWGSISSEIGQAAFPTGQSGFTAADWGAVTKQLAAETAQMTEIPQLIINLQTPFGGANIAAAVDLKKIVDQIEQALAPPSDAGTGSGQWIGISSAVFGLLWAVLPEPFGNIAGVFSEAFAMAGEFTGSPDGDGGPDLVAKVQATADDLGSQLRSRYADASTDIAWLRDILATDYGKLEAVIRGPGFSTQALNAATDALRTATPAWAEPLLLGAVFHNDPLESQPSIGPGITSTIPYAFDAGNFGCIWYSSFTGEQAYHPFPSPGPAQYLSLSPVQRYVLAGPGDPTVNQEHALPQSPVRPVLPPETLLGQMFTAPGKPGDTTNLGVFAPHFFEQTIGLSGGTTVGCPYDPASIDRGVAALSEGPGQLNVFFVSGGVLQNDYLQNGMSWGGPGPMPGQPDGGSNLAAASDGPGDAHVFFLQNGALQYDWYSTTQGWQGPVEVGGVHPDRGTGLAAASPGPGQLTVVFQLHGRLVTESSTNGGADWTPGAQLPGIPAGGTSLAAASWGPGDIHVFFVSNLGLENDWFTSTGWQGPGPVPGPADRGTGMTAVSTQPGDVNVMFMSHGKLVNSYYTPSAGWGGPGPLATSADGGAGLAAASAGPLDAHVFFQSHGLLSQVWLANGWQGPELLPGPYDSNF